jgi:hypothetical protein
MLPAIGTQGEWLETAGNRDDETNHGKSGQRHGNFHCKYTPRFHTRSPCFVITNR